MGTLAENVAQAKADFKAIKDMAHRTIGSFLDNVPTSEYAERMEESINSNYDQYYYNGMEQGRTEGYESGKADGVAESSEAVFDDLFGGKTDWSYFSYYGGNSQILEKLSPHNTRSGTIFKSMCANSPQTSLQFNINTSNGTNFGKMFYNCTNLITVPTFDTSNGTNFNSMFRYCYKLESIPVFNTCNGTNFDYMFEQCNKLTSVTGLSTNKGTSLNSMFYQCKKLKSISQIDFSSATNASSAFFNCAELVKIIFHGTIAIRLDIHWSTKLSRESILSLLQCLNATVSGITITLPTKCIDTATDTLALIQGDTELNTAYTQALANGYTITFA